MIQSILTSAGPHPRPTASPHRVAGTALAALLFLLARSEARASEGAGAMAIATTAGSASAITGVSISQFDQIIITATHGDHNTVVVAPNAAGDAIGITMNGESVSFPLTPFLSIVYVGGGGGSDTYTCTAGLNSSLTLFSGGNHVVTNGASNAFIYGNHNYFDSQGGGSNIYTYGGPDNTIVPYGNIAVNASSSYAPTAIPGIFVSNYMLVIAASHGDHNVIAVSDGPSDTILVTENGSTISVANENGFSLAGIAYYPSGGGFDAFTDTCGLALASTVMSNHNRLICGADPAQIVVYLMGDGNYLDAGGKGGTVFVYGTGEEIVSYPHGGDTWPLVTNYNGSYAYVTGSAGTTTGATTTGTGTTAGTTGTTGTSTTGTTGGTAGTGSTTSTSGTAATGSGSTGGSSGSEGGSSSQGCGLGGGLGLLLALALTGVRMRRASAD
jgi:hypothetical protein